MTIASLAADQVVVPRSEFEQMKKEMAEMRRELNELKAERPASPKASAEVPRGTTAQALALLSKRVDDIAATAEISRLGETKFHLAGSASTTFAVGDNGESNFSATFNPILLWQLNKDLLFEGEVEFKLEDHHTSTELKYAHLDWSLGDYVTFVAGKFASPMNAFAERYEPRWINKLPDNPFAVFDGIVPDANVGFQLRGVIPITRSTKLNLSAYVSNSPSLTYDRFNTRIDFDNFDSHSDHKAFGGHVGIEFCPNFEIGYGFQRSRLETEGSSVVFLDRNFEPGFGFPDGRAVNSLQQSVDLQASIDALKGHWTLLGQYVWSDSDRYSFTEVFPGFSFFDPFTGFIIDEPPIPFTTHFNNHRKGGYVQLSYRGKGFEADFFNRLEAIVRADRLDSRFREFGDIERLTFGLDYWITESTVLKTAYEITHTDDFSNTGTFLFGIATGL